MVGSKLKPSLTTDCLESSYSDVSGERSVTGSRYRTLRWCFWLIVLIHAFPVWLLFETLKKAANENPLRFGGMLAVPVSAISVSAVWYAWTNRPSLEKWTRLSLGIGATTLACVACYRVTFDSNGMALFPFTCVGAWLAAAAWRSIRTRELLPPTREADGEGWLSRWLPRQPMARKQVGIWHLMILLTVFALPFAWVSAFQSATVRSDFSAQLFAFGVGMSAGAISAEVAEIVWAGHAASLAALLGILLFVVLATASSVALAYDWVDAALGVWVLFAGPLASFAALKRSGYQMLVTVDEGTSAE